MHIRAPLPQGAAPSARHSPAAPTRSTPLRVAFCGPIAEAGKPAGGGYEAANRRTCDALARRGLQVIELPYPKATASRWGKLAGYAASFMHIAAYLLTRRDRYDVAHLTPLNMHFAWAENLLISCARWAGKPLLLDIRAGTFVRHYEQRGMFYRHIVDRSLKLASQTAVEGQDYVAFVRRRTHRPVFYFPNYVDTPSLQAGSAARAPSCDSTVRLLYFGRMVPEKGVATAIDALALLRQRGIDAELELIGDGPQAFVSEMKQRAAELPVRWSAGLPMNEILQRARQAHFFFFASRHDGEGHSNALNEAMSAGLVPVCSSQGFSRTVVANAGFVLSPWASAEEYAKAIERAMKAGRWKRLSERARSRVLNFYSEEATVPALIGLYQRTVSATASPTARG